jgi:hypothetical protein
MLCLWRNYGDAGTINGDLYASGGQVVVDGTVNGDILVAGESQSIGKRFSGCVGCQIPGSDLTTALVLYGAIAAVDENALAADQVRSRRCQEKN